MTNRELEIRSVLERSPFLHAKSIDIIVREIENRLEGENGDDQVRKAAEDLSDALEYGLDLSDTYTLEQPDDEPVSATRSPRFWRELRAKHIALRAALSADEEAKT